MSPVLSKFLENSIPQGFRISHLVAYLAVAYLFCATFYRLVLRPYFLSPLCSLPGPPSENIFMGDYREMVVHEPHQALGKWAKRYGAAVHMVGPLGVERLMILKPEALHHIMAKDWLQYPRPAFLRNILGLVSGYGLLTATGDEHRQIRKALNPAFTLSNLMAQSDMYWESIDGLVELLEAKSEVVENGAVISVYEWMSKVTLDILCETAFGYKADTLHDPHNELGLAYHKFAGLQTATNFFKLMVGMTVLPGFPCLLASNWAYRNRKVFDYIPLLSGLSTMIGSLYEIRRISKKLLDEKLREADFASNEDGKRDVMSVLTRARKAEEQNISPGCYGMNEQVMIDQVASLTVLGAGHGTIAAGLTWALWLLANHKESQKKLRQELEPLMGSGSRPDFRELKDLKWLDCVVMESLRVMPPVPVTVRIAKETGTVDGIVIPQGTLIYIPIRAVNTCTATWGEDAEEFCPERWLNLPKAYHPSYSFLSFFAGPHTCIGKTMAIYEMKAILAYVSLKNLFGLH
ncbi:hypothetical protein Agabi119p4_4978 [Agaricus bisporus var. burnettii]|uniref:Cytochrome P450 n=1 Tax=Agaricus bisporus var. burnettii TaxID=192524 RepID=A0A8H7F485_AGABI|nr:hypothetical protein Agabi119p4_4978 [Agaricus bisporus var. burnettii]